MMNVNRFFSPRLGGVEALLTKDRGTGISVKKMMILPDFEAYTSEDSGQLVVQNMLKATAKACDCRLLKVMEGDTLTWANKTYRIVKKTAMDDGELVMLTLNFDHKGYG